jgi:hypothetical protein
MTRSRHEEWEVLLELGNLENKNFDKEEMREVENIII